MARYGGSISVLVVLVMQGRNILMRVAAVHIIFCRGLCCAVASAIAIAIDRVVSRFGRRAGMGAEVEGVGAGVGPLVGKVLFPKQARRLDQLAGRQAMFFLDCRQLGVCPGGFAHGGVLDGSQGTVSRCSVRMVKFDELDKGKSPR